MVRTRINKKEKMKKSSGRRVIELATKSYNKHATKDWMDKQSDEALIRNCHPKDRYTLANGVGILVKK